MICTVTFNPSLDYIVSVDDFQLGMTNRTSSELILPGGKGINVSIVLKNLGLDSTALGYAAGFTGEELIRRLNEFGVNADFIKIDHGMTRINLKLKSIDGTEINGCGPDIDAKALEQLMEKIDRLGDGDVLVLAGSIPYTMPDDIYQRILERIQGRGVLTVVDATRDLLVKVLPYHPFLVKPNNHELGDIFGVKLSTREEVVPYGRKLQEMGAQNVLNLHGRRRSSIDRSGRTEHGSSGTEGNTGQWCGCRRFHGGRFPDRMDGKERLCTCVPYGNCCRKRQCIFRESGHQRRSLAGITAGRTITMINIKREDGSQHENYRSFGQK